VATIVPTFSTTPDGPGVVVLGEAPPCSPTLDSVMMAIVFLFRKMSAEPDQAQPPVMRSPHFSSLLRGDQFSALVNHVFGRERQEGGDWYSQPPGACLAIRE
jgi:hypothetical protein